MSDFSVRSDNVDVEQIMKQIRSRIREKRGVDYTEDEIRELANVKLEKFIDPKGVRSGLLEEYRRLASAEPAPPNFSFGEDTLYETHRGPIRWLRKLLRPLLKLQLNPNPLIQALHIQSQLNERNAERHARLDALHYEVIHNLVVELTRTGIEVKSLKMRLESISSRLDFDERRARALEGVVQYRAGAVPPVQPPTGQRDQHEHRDHREHREHRDQGRRDQNQPRPQGPREHAPREHAPRESQPPQQPQQQQQPGGQGNNLDNDGNERRARRRRRRGRRRGGEGRPEGTSPVAGDFSPRIPGEAPAAEGGSPSIGDLKVPATGEGEGAQQSAPEAPAPSDHEPSTE
jgi:hypothetical protein